MNPLKTLTADFLALGLTVGSVIGTGCGVTQVSQRDSDRTAGDSNESEMSDEELAIRGGTEALVPNRVVQLTILKPKCDEMRRQIGSENDLETSFCTGTIIAHHFEVLQQYKQYVLTAAHCIQPKCGLLSLRQITIKTPGAVLTARQVYLGQPGMIGNNASMTEPLSNGFPALLAKNDIAVIEFDAKKSSSSRNQTYISNTPIPQLEKGASLQIFGYGATGTTDLGGRVGVLRTGDVQFEASVTGLNGIPNLITIPKTGTVACVGDSGGPLYSKGQMIGVLSKGYYDRTLHLPTLNDICNGTLSNTYVALNYNEMITGLARLQKTGTTAHLGAGISDDDFDVGYNYPAGPQVKRFRSGLGNSWTWHTLWPNTGNALSAYSNPPPPGQRQRIQKIRAERKPANFASWKVRAAVGFHNYSIEASYYPHYDNVACATYQWTTTPENAASWKTFGTVNQKLSDNATSFPGPDGTRWAPIGGMSNTIRVTGNNSDMPPIEINIRVIDLERSGTDRCYGYIQADSIRTSRR